MSDAITRPSLSILATILKPHYFNELRTNQNLGYVVNVSSQKLSGMNFLVLKIQSSSADSETLQLATDAFLVEFREKLASGSFQEDFNNAREGLKTAYRVPYRSNTQVLNMLVNQISNYSYEYDVMDRAYSELENLGYTDFIEWC
jgi:secreted Zn-dependent insulinase-like peptidase